MHSAGELQLSIRKRWTNDNAAEWHYEWITNPALGILFSLICDAVFQNQYAFIMRPHTRDPH